MTNSEYDDDEKRVKDACEALGEHFDSVRIFVTRGGGSEGAMHFAWGSGNWFAAYGQIQHWIRQANAEVDCEAWMAREAEDDD